MIIIIAYFTIGFALTTASIYFHTHWEFWAILVATIAIQVKSFVNGQKSV